MKKILRVLLCIICLLVLVLVGYAAYLFLDYERLEDSIALDTVNPHMPAERAPFETLHPGEEKTILSWNIGFGAYTADYSFFMDGGTEARARSAEDCERVVEAAVEEAAKTGADFVLLQEVDEKGTRSHGVNQRDLLEQAMPLSSAVFAQNYDSSYLFYPLSQPIGANRSGILTLSEAEIESAVRRSLPIEQGFTKFFDLDRCYSVSRIPVSNGRELALYNLHLSAYTSDGAIVEDQLRLLLADMAAEYAAGNYAVAGGDFNKDLWGDSSAYTGISTADLSWCKPFPTELLPEGITLVSSLDEEDPVLSCRNADKPYEKGSSLEITLDGFLVSANVQVNDCEVIDAGFVHSDHNPVRMDFVLEA